MERNYTAHVECLGYMYVTLVRSRSEWRSSQVLSPMNFCFDDWVWKFYTCIDVIKRNASDLVAINYEFIAVTMRLQSIAFCNF